MSAWARGDTTPTLLSNAWRIRSILCRTKSAIFQGRPKCPLLVGLCLQSRLHHALPDLLSQVLANLYHVQEVAVPMKHRSWSDVITKEMVALGNCRKPMPPKPYEGRSDLILAGLLTTAPAFLIVNHIHYLFRLSWYLARRCPAMIPDMQIRTSQCVSVIANRLSCFLQDGSRP